MLKIGAHVSASVKLALAVERAQKIGADCFQFFISPPQQWVQTNHKDEDIQEFVAKSKEAGIGPNFIHGTYLVNLGTDKKEHLDKSIAWLKYALDLANKLKVTGVIFHTGSHRGRGFETVLVQITAALKTILDESKGNSYLILENSAGAGGSIGRTFSELGNILKAVDSQRLKVCLDTCHAFATGYDLKTPLGLKNTLAEFDREIGLENLVAIHANDTKFDLGSNKDRHENIGQGFINKEGFKNLTHNKDLQNIPFILEVPGFSGEGPDKENIDLLKSIAGK